MCSEGRAHVFTQELMKQVKHIEHEKAFHIERRNSMCSTALVKMLKVTQSTSSLLNQGLILLQAQLFRKAYKQSYLLHQNGSAGVKLKTMQQTLNV